jgi:hypothetical protein
MIHWYRIILEPGEDRWDVRSLLVTNAMLLFMKVIFVVDRVTADVTFRIQGYLNANKIMIEIYL